MGKTENTIQVFKQIHPDALILVKCGKFYNAYGKDSYIMSYLFHYQLKRLQANYSTCGFPETALNKVFARLEEKKISYKTVLKRDNYEVIEEMDFKKENQYDEIFTKAHLYVTYKNRIDGIYEYMLDSVEAPDFKRKLVKVEETLYEAGTI